MQPPTSRRQRRDPPGLAARRLAVAAIDGVLRQQKPFSETLEESKTFQTLEPRDRAFTQALCLATCRRLGQILIALDDRLESGLPRRAGALEAILATAVAQLLYLDVPDHAAVDIAVSLAREDSSAQAFAGLANAVLRAIARDKDNLDTGTEANLPEWLGERWARSYGGEVTSAITRAHVLEAPLDLTAKGDLAKIAALVGGVVLPTGTIRIIAPSGPIPALPGFEDGIWWVQDMAAQLPVLAMGVQKSHSVLDLCAAPGGKTAALAARGAKVTAVERRPERMARLARNMDRLKLKAELIVRDMLDIDLEPFDAVLLDAPCSATGTIRRHPDVAWIKQEQDIVSLAALQERLLEKALRLVKPGGRLVYSTCSLEPEEGERQIEKLLKRRPEITRDPISAGEIGGLTVLITPQGELRSRPDMLWELGGIDGFFVSRLRVG